MIFIFPSAQSSWVSVLYLDGKASPSMSLSVFSVVLHNRRITRQQSRPSTTLQQYTIGKRHLRNKNLNIKPPAPWINQRLSTQAVLWTTTRPLFVTSSMPKLYDKSVIVFRAHSLPLSKRHLWTTYSWWLSPWLHRRSRPSMDLLVSRYVGWSTMDIWPPIWRRCWASFPIRPCS